MKVIYKTIVEEIDDVVEQAKQLGKNIDHIILTEAEAWSYFVRFESLLRNDEMKGFLDFKVVLIDEGFYHNSVKLKMGKYIERN